MAFRPFAPNTALKTRPVAYGAVNPSVVAGAIAIPVILGVVLLPSLVIYPWIVKQFKPEWAYGKRFATGLLFNIGLGAIYRIAGVSRGGEKAAAATTTAPATTTPAPTK
jgi:hypothetical protein